MPILALTKKTTQAEGNNTNSCSPEKCFLLSISIDLNEVEGKINEFVEVKIKDIRGRTAVFGVPISGQITSLLRSEPERIFLGYIKPTDTIEKKIRITNKKKNPIEITGIEFPENVAGSYDIVDGAAWQKDIVVKIRIPNIKNNVGKFPINLIVLDKNNELHTISIPCVYIGEINVRTSNKMNLTDPNIL